ncbi:hypothetical protein N7481_008699 [Penicillium waksmanii]|uniref:uncharacterized protein n=1 Tax=Penicillium waksmanii TaxID=69791 RepID=UPI0025467E4B|nr:uncharacterized protein N7481_008699 [Penicillium waksmanii]KAJ5974992.1 hypothetical protein N7481_008699 [Penicillium waksmanii]
MELEMADNPFQTLSPSEDASGALSKSPPARPDPSPFPSYGSGKEPEPPLPVESEHHPTTSQSYDEAGGGQGYLAHEVENAEPDQSSPNPPFQPFFTIIEDAHSSSVHHPTVHYIFSDDDTDIIKEAGFRSLEIQGITIPAEKKEKDFEDDPDSPTDPDPNEEDKSILPPAIPGVRTHYLLLDVEPFSAPTEQVTPDAKNISTSPAGPGTVTSPISPPAANPAAVPHTQYRVTSAKSFSPTWQILNADLVPAPTFDSQDANDGPSHGMMLNIRGTGGVPKDPRSKEDGLEALMGRFERHMSELQAVIDSAKVEEVEEVGAENEQAVEHEGENESKAEVDAEAETEIEAHGAELP